MGFYRFDDLIEHELEPLRNIGTSILEAGCYRALSRDLLQFFFYITSHACCGRISSIVGGTAKKNWVMMSRKEIGAKGQFITSFGLWKETQCSKQPSIEKKIDIRKEKAWTEWSSIEKEHTRASQK